MQDPQSVHIRGHLFFLKGPCKASQLKHRTRVYPLARWKSGSCKFIWTVQEEIELELYGDGLKNVEIP